jgi:hypothetical protein
MRRRGSRVLPFSATQALAGQRLLGGPLVITGWSATDGSGTDSLQTSGTVVAPAAGATIASLSLPNGTYSVAWTVELGAGAAAADANNVELFVAGVGIAVSANLGAAGEYPQEEATAFVSFGPLTLAAKAIGAGTAAVPYTVVLTITQTNESLANIKDGGMTIGIIGMGNAASQTQWFDDMGPRVDTDLSIQTTLGSVQGAIWYYLLSDLAEDEYHEHK